MTSRRVGQYYEKSGRAYFRVAIGDERPSFPIALPPGPRAERRAEDVEAIVRKLRERELDHAVVAKLVREATGAESDEAFANIKIVIADVCGEEFTIAPGLSAAMTFDELFWRWQKNALHALFPDHVRKLKASTAESTRRSIAPMSKP
jgi:hypothetical protein